MSESKLPLEMECREHGRVAGRLGQDRLVYCSVCWDGMRLDAQKRGLRAYATPEVLHDFERYYSVGEVSVSFRRLKPGEA